MRTEPTPLFLKHLHDAFSAETLEERVDSLEYLTNAAFHDPNADADDRMEATCALIAWFTNASEHDRSEVLNAYNSFMVENGLPTFIEMISGHEFNIELLEAYGVTTKVEPQGHWLDDYDLENPVNTPCPPGPSDGRPELGQPGFELE